MEKETRRIRRAEKKPSGLANWLRREGRRCCAVALCVSMIVGNAANLAFAAEESISGSFLFRLDRASLYDALQEAVMEGDIVDKEFEFQGEAAEEYDLLLNEMEGHDGELYELKPEIAHNEGNLGLRIFARLDGEIPLGDEEETVEYEITGSEEFIFLLTNRSHKEYQAVIQVDDKRSEVITVVPGSSLQAGLEDSPYTSAADFGPGETEGAGEVTDTGITTAPGGGSSGGGGGGGGGGSSHKDNTPQEGAEDTANHPESGENSQGGDSAQNPEDQGAEEKDHNNGSAQEGEASGGADNSSNDSNGAEMNGSDHNDSNGSDSGNHDSGSNDSGQNDSDKSDSGDSSTSEGGSSENSGSSGSGSGSSGSDHSSGSGSSGDGAGSSSGSDGGSSSSGGSSSGSGSDSSSSGSSSSGSSSSGSSSSGSSSSGSSSSGGGSSDSGSSSSGGSGSSGGDSGSSGGGEQTASISRHGVSLVAMSLDEIVASPSNAEAAEKEEIETEEIPQTEKAGVLATDADAEEASPSDADEELLDGQIYEAALLGDDAVVAFVTTAAEMLLDEEDYRTASPSNAYPAKIREFQADGVVVVVEAEDGVLPEDAELTVKELVKEEADTADQYEQAERALEEAGTEYAGMMAFDISFWLDGEEIEPEGPVQVSMRVDSEKLPKEADPESLEIHHLVGTDEIEAVEIVADSGDKAEGIIEVDEAEALAAEFEVESFSTFTITWGVKYPFGSGDVKILINATCYDEAGKLLTVDDRNINIPYYQGQTEATIDLSENSQISQIGPYNFVKASTVLKGKTIEFTKCGINVQWMPGENEKWKIFYADVYYYNGNDQVGVDNGIDNGTIIKDYSDNTIRLDMSFVYQKDDSQIRITDTVKNNGFLKAELSPELISGNEGGVIYKWYKNTKEDFETAEEVTETLVTGNDYNLSTDGSSVNVALDMGAEHYYWVKVYEKKEGDKAGELLGTSAAYYIGYSDELKNGGFEKPELGITSDHMKVGTGGLEWKTTEDTQTVEIVRYDSMDHNIFRIDGGVYDAGVPEGIQCGEINSIGDGALYQDVLTIPGSTLYWQLYHRARGHSSVEVNTKKTDTMYVVIMATQDAENLFQTIGNEGVTREIRKLIEEGDCPGTVWELTDDGTKWWFHNDAYTVTEGQYLTRFFFVSGDEKQISNGDMSQGNLLDDVSFSTELKPPSKEKGHLSITKVVEGLSQEEVGDYKVRLSIKDEKGVLINKDSLEGVESNPIELDNFIKTSDTTYSATCVIPNLNKGKYKISEEVVTSGNLSIEQKYTAETPKVKKNGETDFSELPIGKSVETEISARSTSSIQIVNAYKDKVIPKTLTIEKEVKNGNKNEEFKFQYKVLNGNDEISESEYENIKVYEGDNVDNNATGRQFTLKDGQKKRIEGIPSGYRVVVTELEASDYETLITHKEGSPIEPGLNSSISQNNAAIVGKSFELDITEDTEVLFTNSKKVITPTGVHTNSLPHLLLLAMAALGMAGMAATGTTAKARKKNDEQ